jgi:hypothetical protein
MSLIKLVENCNLDKLYNKTECHVVSDAFSMSKNTAVIDILLFKLRVTWYINLIQCSVMLLCSRKPNWLPLSRLLSSLRFWTIFRMTVSNTLPVVNRRLIGRKLWGNFGPLSGFGNVLTFASFQDFGKCDSWRQSLYECVHCANGLLGRCVRHSFWMPSIPQAFPTFRV